MIFRRLSRSAPTDRPDPKIVTQRRPTVRQWLWYALGGGLPPELSQWVLADITGRTWVLRHLARALVQLSPLIIAVLAFTPAPAEVRVYGVVGATFTGLFYSVAMMWGTTEHRLIKAGFAPGVAEQAREERVVRTRRERAERLRERD